MKRKLIAGSLAALAIAGGTAGAIAASNTKDDEQAVLADAAKRLGVGTDELRSALAKAQDAQLDAKVKAGELTQEQADAIKERRAQEGTVLGLGGHRGGHGPGGHIGFSRETIAAAAKALGVSERQLFSQLEDDKAEAKAAVKTAATESLAQKLKDGDITQAQHDEIIGHLDEAIDRIGDFRGRGPGGPGFGHHGPGPIGGNAKAEAAVRKAARAELDAAVKAGRITDAQRDEILEDFGRFRGRP